MSAVLTSPNSPSQNIIQATADVPDLTLRPFSDAQSSPILRGQNAAGTVNTFVIQPNGTISSPGTGAFSERFGHLSGAPGIQSTALGQGSFSFGSSTVAIGSNASTAGDNATAIGGGSTANTALATAIGSSADAENASICIGAGSFDTATGQLVIGSGELSFNAGPPGCPITDAYIGNGVTFTTPVSLVIHATGGRGANVGGGNIAIAGGKSTGNVNGGDVRIQTSPAGGAGSTANALATMAQFTGDGKIGLFGVAPVIRQTGGASTATLVYSSTERDMLNALWTAMRAYGLLT